MMVMMVMMAAAAAIACVPSITHQPCLPYIAITPPPTIAITPPDHRLNSRQVPGERAADGDDHVQRHALRFHGRHGTTLIPNTGIGILRLTPVVRSLTSPTRPRCVHIFTLPSHALLHLTPSSISRPPPSHALLPQAKKYFLVLMTGRPTALPRAIGEDALSCSSGTVGTNARAPHALPRRLL